MPRMIDQIRAGGKLAAPFTVSETKQGDWIKHTRAVSQQLENPQLPVLVIDNVSEYYYTGSDQEYWDLQKDFPNLAPPWPQFWCEHRMARKIHSKQEGDTDMSQYVGPNARVGVLLTALKPEDVGIVDMPSEIRAKTKWFLWGELFLNYDYIGGPSYRAEGLRREGAVAEGPHGSIFMMLDERGAIVERPWLQTYLADNAAPHDHEVARSLISWLHPTLLSVCFLHCKNVSVEEHAMDAPLAKKFRQKHNREPAKWKTLVIEPLKQILRGEGRSGTLGLAKAMHICRGHFRDYREGRGLFGKYHGEFWQPAHVKGTKGKLGPRQVEVRVPTKPD